MDISALRDALGGRSRRSIFRDLASIGYFSSYTHTGRYYTLAHIPEFDEHDLWFFQDIGFARAGTLIRTLVVLTHEADAGKTHMELEQQLRLRVHNTLLALVKEERIGRERIEGAYLYLSTEQGRAAEQLARRKELWAESEQGVVVLTDTTVIEVLREALVAGGVLVAPRVVAARLLSRGVVVAIEQVKEVFARYRIDAEKKTARLVSKRSRG
jgi:hypothetical protein